MCGVTWTCGNWACQDTCATPEHPCLGPRRNFCFRSWEPTAGRVDRRRRERTPAASAERSPRWFFLIGDNSSLFFDKLLQVIRQAALRKFTSRNGVRKKWWVCQKYSSSHGCHRKLSGSSCLGQQQLSQHALSTGTTSGSGEPKLPQSAPSSSRSASTSTASLIQGPEP